MAETKTTFTPGPWAAGPQGLGGHVWIRSDDGDFIASVPKGDVDPQKSNAAMIAAAPDLYAALDQAVRAGAAIEAKLSEGKRIEAGFRELLSETFRSASAALRRARGEG